MNVLKIVKKDGKYTIKTRGVLYKKEYLTWDGKDGIHAKDEICLFDTKEDAEKVLNEWNNGLEQWTKTFEECNIDCKILKGRI